LKTGRLLSNIRDSGNLRGEVLVLFIYIQSGPISISAALSYVCN